MDKVQIHGISFSTYTRTARMAAIEKHIDHELLSIDYGKPSHFALHPFGKMPALTHGAIQLFETLAIVSYLDDISGVSTLFGDNPVERAKILGAITVAVDYSYRPVVHIDTDEGVATPDDLAKAAKTLDWLEGQLTEHSHVVTNDLSAADLFFAPMVAYHANQVGDGVAFRDRPKIEAWLTAIAQRPSFATTGA